SYVGDSMWKLYENSNEYYLHSYSEKQPDMNWENPKVRQEMQDMMRFWLDLGFDGYRIDAVNMISKDTSFP
ncbi:alpha-amylase family glycosyl hydrolase, partial [Paenibacillus sp. PsM32]|uniref:alpha-amylase family glycosyl hydrolase n=1 Tax=Paenibacillus sp. PsM32 TaxID=3030536 RepID=UPI00263B689B